MLSLDLLFWLLCVSSDHAPNDSDSSLVKDLRVSFAMVRLFGFVTDATSRLISAHGFLTVAGKLVTCFFVVLKSLLKVLCFPHFECAVSPLDCRLLDCTFCFRLGYPKPSEVLCLPYKHSSNAKYECEVR